MDTKHALAIATFAALVATSAAALSTSPYAGQETREIKALSPQEITGYEAGKGMGFAKAAELNGFAGPGHVLELADQLHLSAEQRARTQALFTSMSARASASGRLLVDKERELDQLFATGTVRPSQLEALLEEIGKLQAKVRAAHLEAHLAQVEILTPEQNTLYGHLRGYGPSQEQSPHHR